MRARADPTRTKIIDIHEDRAKSSRTWPHLTLARGRSRRRRLRRQHLACLGHRERLRLHTHTYNIERVARFSERLMVKSGVNTPQLLGNRLAQLYRLETAPRFALTPAVYASTAIVALGSLACVFFLSGALGTLIDLELRFNKHYENGL